MLQIPDRNGRVPALEPWPPTQTGLIGAYDSNPSGVHIGLFATVEGLGLPIGVIAGRPLDEASAWLDMLRGPVGGAAQAVAAVSLPRATGLGVMLTNHGFVQLAVLRRLAPTELAPAPPARGGISDMQGQTAVRRVRRTRWRGHGSGRLRDLRQLDRRRRAPRRYVARRASTLRRLGTATAGLRYPSRHVASALAQGPAG